MKRLALVLAALVLLLPAAARGDACSPLSCAPSQFELDHGTLLAVRGATTMPVRVLDLRTGKTKWKLPAGIVENGTLVAKQGPLLAWYDLATGKRAGSLTLASGDWQLVGASQDGARAVLERAHGTSTDFAAVSRSAPEQLVTLPGRAWTFDALSGSNLFLIQTVSLGYYVRLVDLATGKLQQTPLKGPGENALISGIAFARASSVDGGTLFTLYIGSSGGAMIHELDLVHHQAICIGLPGVGSFAAATTWALVPDPDGRTLWAISPGYGRVAAIDIAAHRIRRQWEFNADGFNENAPGTAAMSPDGEHFAVTDAQSVWFITLGSKLTVRKVAHVATAIGWAPDQSRLWVVGERSRVSSLPLR